MEISATKFNSGYLLYVDVSVIFTLFKFSRFFYTFKQSENILTIIITTPF